jgi:L-asparaginase II
MARWWPRAKSALVAKSGAEGYFCVGHADGLGLALKIIDADPAARARNLATVVAIRRAGWISNADLNGALRAFGPRVPIFQSGWPLHRRGPAN